MRNLVSTAASIALLLGMGVAIASAPTASHAQIGIGINISVNFAPPALPVYVQPAIPAPGYFWTPGYWAWDDVWDDYYWVPGTWVQPPVVGVLWTPGYWGWNNGNYVFNTGYWGPTIGFYGGVSYGFGYTGVGYAGGYWQGGHLFYNTAVNNVAGVTITNVYNKTVIVNNTTNVSFNGPGGVTAKPTAAEQAAATQKHIAPTAEQTKQVTAAKALPANHASVNAGKPAVAATPKAGVMKGPGVVAAKSAPTFRRPANAPPAKIPPAVAKTLPPAKGAAPAKGAGATTAKGAGPTTAKGAPPKPDKKPA